MASLSDPLATDEGGAAPKVEENATDLWQEALRGTLQGLVKSFSDELGMYPGMAEQWIQANFSSLLRYLKRDVMLDEGSVGYYTRSARGLTALTNISLQWISGRIPGMQDAMNNQGGGGGGGVGKPVDIRAQFDLSQLASEVTKMSRGYLLQEHKDPRGLARAYVDAVVKNPDQNLDFQTFVVDHLKANPRWGTLYKHKPAALDELQYIGQYTSVGQQMLGANSGQDWSGEQAHAMALGADPQAWNERLERSNSYTSQAPFIAKLEAKVSGLSHILKG